MYKVPSKFKRQISAELKKYHPIIRALHSRGKSTSEDDARIVLNDVLSDVLGYDKYTELKTEMREKNQRFDYVVKLQNEGPNAKKKDRFDFVIEAKAAHVELSESHVNQTLHYCLGKGMDYFFLTNAVHWRLYQVKQCKKNPSAELLFEVDFTLNNSIDDLAEEFYLFSKAAYVSGEWLNVAKQVSATKTEDVVAILLSDKVVRVVSREVQNLTGIKVSEENIRDTIKNQVLVEKIESYNKKVLKKLNEKPKRKHKEKNPNQENLAAEHIACESNEPEEGAA